MSTRPTLALACALCALCVTAASAFDVASTGLHLHLSGLKEARPPELVEGHLVLSAKGSYRYVGASFSHESWSTLHPFEKNYYGVFVLAIPLPYGDATTLRYRLVLDGLWAADPANPRRERDPATGLPVSLADLPARPRTVLGTWNPAGDGCATFYFTAEPGQRVTVAGSFNAWDPFVHEMTETAPGRYELRLALSPGVYYYYFVYRGQRLPDPLNSLWLYGEDGGTVSAITVARR